MAMKADVLKLTRAASLAGAATAAVLCAGGAQAQEGGTTALEEIQVTGEGRKDTARGPVEGYVATRSSAGTKTDTPILETPRSVEVIGRQELEDRGVTTLPEAVRYSPGVTTNGSGFDPRFDQISIRGFAVNTYGDYKDGLRQTQGQFATFRSELFGLERIDIIKGPAAVLYGQTTPGGLIDRISKRPTEAPRLEIMTNMASTGRYESGVDVSGPLNAAGTVLGRMVALGRIGELDYDIKDERAMLAPSLTFAPNDQTKFTIYGLVQKDETDSNVAVMNTSSGDPFNVRASDPSYDHLKQTQYQAGYEFSHEFNDTFTFRQNARYNYLDMDARYLTANVSGGGYDPTRPNVYRRGSYAIEETVEATQIDNQLEAKFETGFVRHTMLFGVDHQWSKSKQGTGSLAANPDYELDVDDPNFGLDGPTPPITTRTDVGLKQLGLYAQDQIKIGDHWNIAAGIRHDWAKRTSDVTRYDGLPLTSSQSPVERKDKALTYNIGVLYAFDNGFSPYASYATSFLPAAVRASGGGGLLKPTEGEQFEVGLKYQPPGTTSLFTAAVYHLTEKNAVKYDPTTSAPLAIGEIETKGVELSARVDLSLGAKIIASYNYNDAEITKDSVEANIGNEPLVTPRHTASLWADYTFQNGVLEGFGLGAGVRYVGSTFSTNSNVTNIPGNLARKNDAYTLFDAGARYDFGKASPKLQGVTLAVNATNLADDEAAVCNSGRCYLSQGRTVIGTLRYRW
ncbi:iron complex outermembrane receptor protein [Methylopila capsulata]|uniref:Iron complex outermembrane receptor protein n=1 Tax=Methylopila capsulata TaxID=61654 RepID=A0A9W6IVI5_9HYPH|nr:TonB-dependent siderophore receptor [Methylopila capsulata]MBM7853425.1 iron complex outermembrane receptor protein [Methylopila capsulata]GLK57362.1 ligand-gated channel [Methylopila capsulata]